MALTNWRDAVRIDARMVGGGASSVNGAVAEDHDVGWQALLSAATTGITSVMEARAANASERVRLERMFSCRDLRLVTEGNSTKWLAARVVLPSDSLP